MMTGYDSEPESLRDRGSSLGRSGTFPGLIDPSTKRGGSQPGVIEPSYSRPASEASYRRASLGRSGSLPDLIGSTTSDTVYLVKPDMTSSKSKFLLGPLVFAYMAAYATTFLVFIQYVYERVHDDIFKGETGKTFSACNDSVNKSDPDFKKQMRVQEEVSDWSTYYSIAAGIPSIFANVVFGCYTDKFGRRFLLLLPCIGSFIKLVNICIVVHFKLSLSYFFIGSIAEGMTGQLFTLLLACFTYIADTTPVKGKERSFAIVIIELLLGLSTAIFLFLSGYLITDIGYFYTLLMCGVLFGVAGSIVFFIPESFPKDRRRPAENAGKILKTIYDLFFGEFNWGRRWMYNVLLVVFTLTMFTVFGRSTVETIYLKDNPFCWSPEKIGRFGAAKSAASQTVGMGLVKLLQIRMSDDAIAILGCVSYIVCYLLEGFAYNDAMMYIVPVIGVFGLLTVPMCRSMLSKLTREDQQGAVFAAIAGMETMINMVGSIVAAQIYANTLQYYRGIVFFVFTAASLVGLVLLSVYRFGSRRMYPVIVKPVTGYS